MAIFAAVALVLRLVNANAGLWYDEVVTLVKYVREPLGALLTRCTDLNNHMLYSLAAKVSVAALGESPFALRLPAILMGVACIPALYWFARRLVSPNEALAAAALATVSSHHVWFSQNARGYTALLFWNLLASGLFIDGMRRPAARTWIAYALVGAASLWTHLTAGFVLAAHGLAWLFALARDRGARAAARGPALAFVGGLILGVALYAAVIPAILAAFRDQAGEASANVKVQAWTNPLWTVTEAMRASGLGPAAWIALGVAGSLALFGWIAILRRDRLAAAIMALPAPIALATLLLVGFHIWPRYFFLLFGFALVCFVHGAHRASAFILGPARGRAPAIALVAVAAVGLAFRTPYVLQVPKQDYEGAREFVLANLDARDRVVTAGLAADAYTWLYEPSWLRVSSAYGLDQVVISAPRTWVIYSFPTVLEAEDPDLLRYLRTRLGVMREFPGTVGDGTIYVCRTP